MQGYHEHERDIRLTRLFVIFGRANSRADGICPQVGAIENPCKGYSPVVRNPSSLWRCRAGKKYNGAYKRRSVGE